MLGGRRSVTNPTFNRVKVGKDSKQSLALQKNYPMRFHKQFA